MRLITLERLFRFSRFGGISEFIDWEETTMKTTWVLLLGAAMLAFAMSDVAKANHFRQGYGGYGGYSYGGYGYGNYGYAPSYGTSGFYNRTDQYHYTHPRVTTGYGFRSAYRSYGAGYYPSYGYGNYGRVNVGYPRGGVNVGWGPYGGGVNVYGGWGGVNVGW